MDWQGWFTLAVVALMVVLLFKEVLGPDIIVFSALSVFTISGILTPAEALKGFSNQGMLTVAGLFVVSMALQNSGALIAPVQRIFGRSRKLSGALMRLMLPTVGLSAFLNNTPVVAMLTPVVKEWAQRNGFSPSKLLIPLSYASILGGICTLIGTSTNLVVSGMLSDAGHAPLGMFEQTPVGLVCAAAGMLYLLFFARRLLPDRRLLIERMEDDQREYVVEMLAGPQFPFAGQTVLDAGLRHLPGLFLAEIERGDQIIAPVDPDIRLASGDRLVFVGLAHTVVDLQKIPGLVPAEDRRFHVGGIHGDTRYVEAVVSNKSPIVGKTIRDAKFRRTYDAVVIAVQRNGERVQSKIGDVRLQPGDTLMLRAAVGFVRTWRNSAHFHLVSDTVDPGEQRPEKSRISLAILCAMVLAASFQFTSMLLAVFGAVVLYLFTRCISPGEARRAVDLSVLLLIACAFGVGHALEKTGAAAFIASAILDAAGSLGPWGVLAAVVLCTSLATEFITNNAAAVLVFPIAMSTASQLGVDPRPFAVAIAFAASSSFATPIGYQTNMLVYGPGGYRFSDFLRVGIPMNLLMGTISVILIPFFWPF